jgi:hypothetical protein
METNRPALTLFVVAAITIAYGSLYPFVFDASVVTPERIAKLYQPARWSSLSDVLGNVALFVPLGIASAAIALSARRRVLILVALAVVCLFGSIVLQIAQLWIPSRTADGSDVIWNLVGFALGNIAGYAAVRTARVRNWHPTLIDWIGCALVTLWAIGEVLPFVPALDWFGLKQSLKSLLAPQIDPLRLLTNIAGSALVLAIVSQAIPRASGIVYGAALVGAVLAMELLSVDRHMTLSTPVGYALGIALWWALRGFSPAGRAFCLFSVAMIAYTLSALAPFELRDSRAAFSWLPFAATLRGAMVINAEALAESSFALLAPILVAVRTGARPLPLAIAVGAWVLGLEWLQTWIESRTGDVTLPLLTVAFGVWLARVVPQRR